MSKRERGRERECVCVCVNTSQRSKASCLGPTGSEACQEGEDEQSSLAGRGATCCHKSCWREKRDMSKMAGAELVLE
jgi:hypothetical protein